MTGSKEFLKQFDPDVYQAIMQEEQREEMTLELIASENAVSRAVLEAQGSVFTNKYAEGYPGKRYYGGCEYADQVEELARQRARSIFGGEHINVQPHSGSQANMGVYMASIQPGDKVLGMSLSHGGHLTHGSKVNFSGKVYESYEYGVNEDSGLIDYDQVQALAVEHKPRIIVAGASAYSRTLDFPRFREIADSVGAWLFVDMAHIAGLVAAGLHPNPVPHAQFVTTTTHKTLRGPRGGMIICTEEYAKEIDKSIFPGIQGGPLVHVIAAKAVAFKEALSPEFKEYQKQIVNNAAVMARTLIDRGFKIVSGGTDNHLFLLDLSPQDITGKDAEKRLELAHITVNKNTVPGEKRSPFITSGIRIGAPTITTRGMKAAEAEEIANYIADILLHMEDEKVLNSVKEKVENLCRRFPLYK